MPFSSGTHSSRARISLAVMWNNNRKTITNITINTLQKILFSIFVHAECPSKKIKVLKDKSIQKYYNCYWYEFTRPGRQSEQWWSCQYQEDPRVKRLCVRHHRHWFGQLNITPIITTQQNKY